MEPPPVPNLSEPTNERFSDHMAPNTFANQRERDILNMSPLSPATATMQGQNEATVIRRDVDAQIYQPMLEIKVNKRLVAAADPTQ